MWENVCNNVIIHFQVITLNPKCENVETAQGVQVTVTGVAQVKVMKEEKVLKIASEQFLGMNTNEMKGTILMTLEGHLRAILGESFPAWDQKCWSFCTKIIMLIYLFSKIIFVFMR